MVQIGSLHVGRTDKDAASGLSIAEAYLLWDLTVSRYQCLEQTQIYLNYAHDPDLRLIIKSGQDNLLEKQIGRLEKQMDQHKIPLPDRPPKSVNSADNTTLFNDQYLFRQIFYGCQEHVDYLARISRSMITSETLRRMVTGFLQDELAVFDRICLYGKVKGWLATPPMYNPI